MSHEIDIASAVQRFLASCDSKTYDCPAGGKTKFLTSEETKLLEVLRANGSVAPESSLQFAEELKRNDCYSLAIFGVRLAIHGVRSTCQETCTIGGRMLSVASPRIDWRDAMIAKALVNDCESRLGIGPGDAGAVESMGYRAVGSGPTFNYVPVGAVPQWVTGDNYDE